MTSYVPKRAGTNVSYSRNSVAGYEAYPNAKSARAAVASEMRATLPRWVTPDIVRLVGAMDAAFFANLERWPTHLLEVAP